MSRDMLGSLAPFEAGLVTMQGARCFTLERREDHLIFMLRLSAYDDGTSAIVGRWSGWIPDHIWDGAQHLLDDEEKESRLLKKIGEIKVPKILHLYAQSDECVRWTIVLSHLRMIAEQSWIDAKGQYEQAMLSLETHMILEDTEDTEQALFNKGLEQEEADNAHNA